MADLKKLEREADEETLEFWEAMRVLELAKSRYYVAEKSMIAAKSEYLRAKLAESGLSTGKGKS